MSDIKEILERVAAEDEIPIVYNPVDDIKNVFFYPKDHEIEFNDEYFLKLLLDHPVMSDPTRYFYGDEYLVPYGWSYITEQFNLKYRECGFDGLFMPSTLEARWAELTPLIKEVNVEPYRSQLPMPLRVYVMEMCLLLDKMNYPKKDIGNVQLNITHNIEYIKYLPTEVQEDLQRKFVRMIMEHEFENDGVYPSMETLQFIKEDLRDVFTLMQGDC